MSADLSIYLHPTENDFSGFGENTLGASVVFYKKDFPELKKTNLAIIGVCDGRRSINNEGCSKAPDSVRQFLYRLYASFPRINIVDLGNILAGNEVEDTYFALSSCIKELIKKKIVPIIIGGGQDLTYANYLAYQDSEQMVNLAVVDNRFDLGKSEDPLNSHTFLSKIITRQPNYLFNYSNIGYQTYFIDPVELNLMSKLFFDTYRLGEIRNNLQEIEPILRNSDILSFDVSAIRSSDAPANGNATPNGFYGEEACQIARYAGISDKISSAGFYELNPSLEKSDQTAHLVAQMVWYFIEGFANRKGEHPLLNKKNYQKFRVALGNDKQEIIFYKSRKTDRWWIDVPYPPNKGLKFERQLLVPCSYTDYQTACSEDMPQRWWKTYQKLL